jgi:hypothetical protein
MPAWLAEDAPAAHAIGTITCIFRATAALTGKDLRERKRAFSLSARP